MGTISLKNAGLRVGEYLFSKLDLVIGAGDRVGLVAPNGRGKSSLLRAMAGSGELSEGEITRSRGLVIGYVQQDIPANLLDQNVVDFVSQGLDPSRLSDESWRVDMVLEEMAIPVPFREKPLRELSGGWQRMALLARCWIGEPDALLLDEPTNHLDLARIALVENWLDYAARSLPVVIASHDRAFLDATTNRTLFIRPSGHIYLPLPYSAARIELDRLDSSAQFQRDRELKQAAQLRRQASKLTNIGINSGSDLLTVKSKQLRDRAEKIEVEVQFVHKERTGLVRLGNSGAVARVMTSFEEVAVETPVGGALFSIDKLHVFQGDRIVLLGHNGAGKSQFMRIVSEALLGKQHRGLRISPQIVPGYLDQSLATLPTAVSPLDFLLQRFDEGDRRTVALLAGAGFAPERQTGRIGSLSPGQRARLALLALRLARPNFYLLDEPTNHLDIPGQEQLETDICEQGATTILVSHDRAFLRAVGTRFFVIDRKKLVEVDGPDAFFAEIAAAG